MIVIQPYTIDDVMTGIRYLLDKSAQSGEVRDLAVQITGYSDDPITKIHEFVRNNVRYTPDPNTVELITSPVKMARDYFSGLPLQEDCDGMATFAVALMQAVGLSAQVELWDTKGLGLDHAVGRVYSQKLGRYVTVDPASHLPLGWEFKVAQRIVL